jgi:hypothetical protein
MPLNDRLFDGDEEDDPFQVLERDDDPIVWEVNKTLRREQYRQLLRRLDELEGERIAAFAEADEALLELLQQFRFDDEGFLEQLDPELCGVTGEDDEMIEIGPALIEDLEKEFDDASREDFEDDGLAFTDQEDEDESDVEDKIEDDDGDENEEEDEEEANEVVASIIDSPTMQAKVDLLERIAVLHRSGHLSESEFESLNAVLLRSQN